MRALLMNFDELRQRIASTQAIPMSGTPCALDGLAEQLVWQACQGSLKACALVADLVDGKPRRHRAGCRGPTRARPCIFRPSC